MTKPMVTCRQCGKSIEREFAIELRKGWYVCSDACAEAWQAAHAPKPKQAANDDRKALLDDIKSLDPNANFTAIAARLKRMTTDYNMSYSGMRYALWWSIEVMGMEYKGIGIMPYIYNDAKVYWEWTQRMKRQVAGWKPSDDEAVVVRHDDEEDVFV